MLPMGLTASPDPKAGAASLAAPASPCLSEASPDAAVLARVRAGDREAYRFIVTRYMQRAYAIALGYVHNQQDALDLSQECFVRAFRKLNRYDPARPFLPWFYELLRNLCLDHLRRRKRRREVPLDERLLPLRDAGLDPGIKRALWRGIQALPPEQKEVVLLRYFQDLSYKEIAELTGRPMGTVMSSLFYAKSRLRRLLDAPGGRGAAEAAERT